MNRPKLPQNEHFWLGLASDTSLVEKFLAKGNPRQKHSVTLTLKYLKWKKIQKRAGAFL